jgi:enolase-phosphatase E1
VYDVLFPYARSHASKYLDDAAQHSLRQEYDADVSKGHAPPPWSSNGLPYVYWLMDQDRKSTALKTLQGKIWQEGYRRGELHGEVFPDVPPALQRWNEAGLDVRIYSSGSILAQQLIFSTTPYGDLTRFLKGYFDTTTGAKVEASSYTTIAGAFALAASKILFISDVTRELDAAAKAGLQVRLAVRPGNPVQPSNNYAQVVGLAEVTPEHDEPSRRQS